MSLEQLTKILRAGPKRTGSGCLNLLLPSTFGSCRVPVIFCLLVSELLVAYKVIASVQVVKDRRYTVYSPLDGQVLLEAPKHTITMSRMLLV